MGYSISLSDPNKTDVFDVEDDSINEGSSLTILGSNVDSYGKVFWENILHLVENFCSPTSPNRAIEGQLWYNSETKVLNIYETNGTEYNWSPVIKESAINLTNYIDTSVISTAVNLRLMPETGPTIYEGPTKNDNHACTKKFADDWHGGITTGSNDFCNWVQYPNKFTIMHGKGDGLITLPFDMQDTNYSVVVTSTDQWNHYSVVNKTKSSFKISGNAWMLVGMAL
jgi:hypothetical protein